MSRLPSHPSKKYCPDMKYLLPLLFTSSLLISSLCLTAVAQPAASPAASTPTSPQLYITDKLYAPVRTEPGEKGKTVHNGLESGTAIIVLEKNDSAGYAKIRTNNNTEGWIRSQYLAEEAPATLQLDQANALIAQLQEKNKTMEAELVSIKQISATQIDTHARNTDLVNQIQLLTSQQEVLQTDNERLKNRNNQTWFIYGGILVALSCIIVALIPRLRKNRRNDGWA
jgi:SH3 domain protein